ncbi:uncharacterized protein DNG_00396 [Cephalotrichum gorgonifer]|uniref:Uncharacterized protein n=1 Tax=Cephalotrichum gorgonifer TaxID=2041049 RepID=A0AAE8MPC4_9PEZI|nr:uncharacterized protein DNG_00396 [Cephalotrichum gorgonifer]
MSNNILPGQFRSVVSDVHDICIDATANWINSHSGSYGRRVTSDPFRRPSRTPRRRAEPYPSSRVLGAERRAQRYRLVVLGSEMIAVENMKCLLEWAGTIVLWEEKGLGRMEEAEAIERAKGAGREICGWVGDEEGKDLIEGLVVEKFWEE